MKIGARIRDLREDKHMTLAELSELSRVQIATLSRMENGKMTGTVESHIRICKALGVELVELYKGLEKEDSQVDIQQVKDQKTDVFIHSEKFSYEILTNKVLSKRMMPVLLKIEPKGQSAKEQNQIGSEKFYFVLDGNIEVHVAEQVFNLTRNNTIYFDSSEPHYMINTGTVMARILSVSTPVSL